MTSASRRQRWLSQVDALGDRLLLAYGPFLVRGSSARPRAPLVSFDRMMSSIRDSFEMEVLLKTSACAYEYVKHASKRSAAAAAAGVGSSKSGAAAKRALAISDRYGLDFPLFLPCSSWTKDRKAMEEFLKLQPEAVPSSSVADSEAAGAGGGRRRALTHAARMAVWNRWQEGGMFAGSGPCHACDREITQQEFECGHVVAAVKGGTNLLDNLRPLCRACNRSMGTMTLAEFKAMLHGPARM